MPNQPSNDVVIDKCTTRISALLKHVESANTVIWINGTGHEVAGVVAIYEDCLLAHAKLELLRAAVRVAMAERELAEAKRVEADRALKSWAIHKFGAASEAALDFGFPPPKAPVRSEIAQLREVALAREMCEARRQRTVV